MALSTKISEAFQDTKIRESPSIDKYNITDYTILYKELDRMNDSLFKISNKYKSQEGSIREKILTVIDDYKSSETVIEINKSLIFKTDNPLFSQDIPNDDDDDSKRQAKDIKNLQNDLINIHKTKDFVKIEKVQRQQIIQRYELYKIKLSKINISAIDSEFERKKEKQQSFIRIIRYVKYTTGIILCVINFVVLTNLFTPMTFINIGLKIYNNKFLFRFFIDTMINLNLFNITDSLALESLFQDMQIELNSKIKDPKKRDTYIKLILHKIFKISLYGEEITNEVISKQFAFYTEDTSDSTKFFNFINAACDKINFFKDETSLKLQGTWLENVFEICNNPSGMYALSQLGLIINTFAYFERAEKIFNQYSEINPAIIFKEIAVKTIQGQSFAIYNRAINESMLKFLLSDQQAKIISEIPFMINLFGKELNVGGKTIKQLTKNDIRGLFVTTSESFTSILTNSYVNGYFDKLEKEAKDKNVDEKILKSIYDRILETEQNIRKRGKLILDGLTNEKVSNLLNRTPKKNDYKFFVFKFMKHYYNNFDLLIDDPLLFAYTLTTSISLSKIMQILMAPTFITGLIYNIQSFTLSGMYNVDIFKLPFPFESWKIKDIVVFMISFFYGSDARINKEINMKRAKIINEIISDFQTMIGELQTIFYDTRVGLHVKNYVNKVNETIFGNIFLMSCKIVYNIIFIPLFQLKLKNIIPKANFKLIEILKNKNSNVKFFSIISNKISNIFTISNKYSFSFIKLFKELKSFFEIDKIMFLNIIPFVANDGYYSYDTSKPFEFKGNTITFLNENFEKRLEKENKKPANQRSNLIDLLPKKDEIEEKIIIINSDSEKETVTYLEYNYLLDEVINSIKKQPNWNQLSMSSDFKKDDIFLYYYYSKFIEFKKIEDPDYDISKPKLKDFDSYLSKISNKLRDKFSSSNSIEYAVVNNVRILFEERYPKNTWSDIINPFYEKNFEESIKLTPQQINNINQILINIDKKDNIDLPVKEKSLNNLLSESSVITVPIQTNYGTVTMISDTREFFKTTQLINAIDSSETLISLNSKYEELEAKANKENNNIIFSELTNLEYALNKPLRVILNNFNILKKYIKTYLPGKEGPGNNSKDEIGVTFKHLGFNYLDFTEKIKDYLQKTIIVINNKDNKLYDLIYSLIDNKNIKNIIIEECDIHYICLDDNKKYLLDISKKIDINTGEKIDCQNTQEIKKAIEDKEILMEILFRPEVLIRLSELDHKSMIGYTKYNKFIDYIKKIVNGITIDEKIEVDGKTSDLKKNITIFSIVDEVIDEQLSKYKTDTDIDKFKMDLLKKFQFTLKETVRRGYIDKDLLKYIKQFFKRKEILLNRYEYINEQILKIKDFYNNLLENCNKLSSDPLIEFDYINLSKLQEILSKDDFNYAFALSDFSKISNAIPGGNEPFGNLFNVLNERAFKIEENKLVDLTTLLKNSNSEIKISGILKDKDSICKDLTESKLIEKYIYNREKWYDDQYKLYRFYLLNKSNEIYSELEKKYQTSNKNLNLLIQEYERRLNIIYRKYQEEEVNVPLTINENVFSDNQSSSIEELSTVTRGKTGVAQAEKGLSEDKSNILGSDTGIGQATTETSTLETGLETDLETGLETGLDTDLETSLSNALQQGYSGDDNSFNFFSSLINVLPAKVTTLPSGDISLESVDSTSNTVQENKSAVDLCESRHGKWWFQYSEETDIYGIKVKGGLSESEALSCARNNVTYDLFYNINSIFDKSVQYMNLLIKTIFGSLTNPLSIGACAFSGYKGAGSAGAVIMVIICAIAAIVTLYAQCTVYLFHFCLSLSIKPLVEQISSEDDIPDISKKILLLGWFYSTESLKKVINENNRNTSHCDTLEGILQTIQPDFKLAEIEEIPKKLLNKINDENGLINKNGIGVIDIGQKEKGQNFSDPTVILGLLSNFLDQSEKIELSALKDKNNEDKLKCYDFNIGDKNKQQKTLKLIINSLFEDLLSGKKPILAIKYISCAGFDNINTILNWQNTWSYATLNLTYLTYNIFRIIDLLIELFFILLEKNDIRNLVLTYLFGSSSEGENKNIGRDMIDNAFQRLEMKHLKNGVINKEEFNIELKKDLNSVFRNFFGNFYIIAKDLFYKLINLITSSTTEEEESEEDVKQYYLDDKNLILQYNNFQNSTNLNIKTISDSLLEPAIKAVKLKFEHAPEEITNIDLNDPETIKKALASLSEIDDAYYRNFELKDIYKVPDSSNQTKQLKAYVSQLINILQLYKKSIDLNQSQERLVQQNINENKAPWFNFAFNNYLYFLNQSKKQDIGNPIYSHLINTCKEYETLIVTTKEEGNQLIYEAKCFELPDIIITSEEIDRYRNIYNDAIKGYYHSLNSDEIEVSNTIGEIKNIISVLNNNCEESQTCIDTSDYDEKSDEIDIKLIEIDKELLENGDLEKYNNNYAIKILEKINLVKSLFKKVETSINDRKKYIQDIEEEMKEPSEVSSQQYEVSINKYKDITDENESKIIWLVNKIKKIEREKQKIVKKETLNNFIFKSMNETDDPKYFAYLYLSVLNLIDIDNLKLSDLFQLFTKENLTKEILIDKLEKLDIYYNDKLIDNIIKNRKEILDIISYFLVASKKDKLMDKYNIQTHFREGTKSGVMFFDNELIRNNKDFMKKMDKGKDVLEIDEKKIVRLGEKREPLYYDLYKYGYYLNTPSNAEIKQKIEGGKISTTIATISRSPILLSKISNKFTAISGSNYPSADYSELFGTKTDYIENNGSLTKFNNMIPPILVDYNFGNKKLDDFVNANYIKDKSRNLWVLKMNIALYENTYEGFTSKGFFDAIDSTISYKKEQIETLINDTYSVKSILYGYNTDYYDEYYSVPFYQEISGMERKGFFDDLKIKDAADSSYDTIRKIYDSINGLQLNNPKLPSIFPINIFQSNLNNINIYEDSEGNVKLSYHITKLEKL